LSFVIRWKTGRFLITSVMTATLVLSVLLVSLLAEPASAGSWPGGNGKIALWAGMEPDCEIFVVNPDGSGFRQLTDNDVCDHSPDWSADGRKLAIERYDGNDYEIWVILEDGRDDHRVTDNSVSDYDPAWSPDESKIAFTRYDPVGFDVELWVINADGTGEQQLTNGYTDYDPEWSPDGSTIAFERMGGSIYVINPDGSGLAPVTDGYSPEWLPDGSRIAFDRRGNIYTVKPDGTDEQQVTTGGYYYDPAWSPEGRKIAFEDAHEEGIWVMNADGTGEKMIAQASDPIEDFEEPDWQPTIARPVGGVVTSVNKLQLVAPYLALVGFVGALTVTFAIRRRKP